MIPPPRRSGNRCNPLKPDVAEDRRADPGMCHYRYLPGSEFGHAFAPDLNDSITDLEDTCNPLSI